MKKTLYTLLFVICALTSLPGSARSFTNWSRPSYSLVPVNWVGEFGCEEKIHEAGHKEDHDCALSFVEGTSGDVWEVRSTPVLTALHRKANGPVSARINAMRSPRFILGSSFLEVSQIEIL